MLDWRISGGVVVDGTEIVRGREFTGSAPGTVLRSGRDTCTVEVPGGSSYQEEGS